MNLEREVWPCEEGSNRKISFNSENTGFQVGHWQDPICISERSLWL